MKSTSRHSMDCGLCCGLAQCDCGVDGPRKFKLTFERAALIFAVVVLAAAYFVGQA